MISDGRILISGGVTYEVLFGIPVLFIIDGARIYTPGTAPGVGSMGLHVDMGAGRFRHRAAPHPPHLQ